ncbi:MAG TPA: hypothetical protein VLM05_02445 [Mycobacteriales bacterium]|nr:hypothetical protein [Mycobacteriales bacterium]
MSTHAAPVRSRTARLLLLSGSVVAIALAAGCVAGAGKDAGTAAQSARTTAAAEAAPLPSGSADQGSAGAEPASGPLTPGEFTLQFQALLGQHTVLAADMMRGRIRNDPDLAQATNAALGKNTDALGKLFSTELGADAAKTFTPLWSGHVKALFNYAGGLGADDQAAMAQAKVSVTSIESKLADFFAARSGGKLTKQAALAGVTEHVSHLLEQADQYAAKDYAKSDATYRAGYAHAFGAGKAIGAALLTPAQGKQLETPTWRLRSALTQLLGEHVELVIGALRSGATDAPDFTAAANAVNGNTTDLAAAIGVLFSPAAGAAFQQLWADHIDLLVRYAAAIAKGDDAARTEISGGLNGFEGRLSAFLSTATGNKLAAQQVAKALGSHDTMLRQQVDAFVAKDYVTAHDVAYSTYQEMFGLSGQLAEAFGETVAKRLPVGPAQTGRGGMAAVIGGR